MVDIGKKVNDSASFYRDKYLNFDLQLAHYNFLTLRPHFKGEKALELGPANGFMTKDLVKEFEILHLLEGSKELLDQIPDYDNIKKHHSLFEDFNSDIKYDTIIMGHVLEHIYNPVEICSKIYNWLSDEGVFLVSVPNAKSIHRIAAVEMGLLNDIHELNSRDHAVGHYRVYDMDLLKKHLMEAGFKIKDSGGIFLKPLSNDQIDTNWDDQMIEGFYKMGKYFPENCAEIYLVCTR